jgi:hypothetical protein
MTVSELIESLEGCEPNTEVILASDAEGNSFCKVDDVYRGYFLPKIELARRGRIDEMYTFGKNEGDDENEYDKDYPSPDDVQCIVIYPV